MKNYLIQTETFVKCSKKDAELLAKRIVEVTENSTGFTICNVSAPLHRIVRRSR